MKNVGEFCGLKIWVPDTGDIISDQESFNLLKYHLEELFPMYSVTPPNIQKEEPKIQPATLKQQTHDAIALLQEYFDISGVCENAGVDEFNCQCLTCRTEQHLEKIAQQ